MKLSELGERKFLTTVVRKLLEHSELDDVYHKDGIVYKMDGFPLSFGFTFSDPYDIGWKSITAAVSDVVAKGSLPNEVMISIGLDPDLEVSDASALMEGIIDSTNYYGGKVVGGDTNGSKKGEGWIDVAIIGKALCYKPLSNAKEGDTIVLTNKIGMTTVAFISFLKGIEVPHHFLTSLRHPVANRYLPLVMHNNCEHISTSTDISDGLLISLSKVAEASGKGVNLTTIPYREDVLDQLNRLSMDPFSSLKYGGEEYEALLVVTGREVEHIMEEMSNWGMRPLIVGKVIEREGLYFMGKKMEPSGWDNFRGWD